MNSGEQFEAIVGDHYESLFRFAMSLTRAESDALDLTQQTFYVWAHKGHQLREPSKVKTWLFTTLHRVFLQTRRRNDRFPHIELDEVSEHLQGFSPEPAEHADCAQVLSALAKVDEVYQAAVALFYLDECSYGEIAEVLAIPLGTVKSRIARGTTQLRRILLLNTPVVSSAQEKKCLPTSGNTREPLPQPRPANVGAMSGTLVPVYSGNDFASCES